MPSEDKRPMLVIGDGGFGISDDTLAQLAEAMQGRERQRTERLIRAALAIARRNSENPFDNCWCTKAEYTAPGYEHTLACLEMRAAVGLTDAGRDGEGAIMDTLGDALPREMSRVRDEVMPAYIACGPAGVFALAMMRADLDAAQRAMIEGDMVGMMRLYESLKGYQL